MKKHPREAGVSQATISTSADPISHDEEGWPMWEVGVITGRKTVRHMGQRQLQYLVRWKGCDSSEDSWELADELAKTAPEAVEAFERSPKARRTGGPPLGPKGNIFYQ
jgi:hypothetical protein